jgi:hypothetical protein
LYHVTNWNKPILSGWTEITSRQIKKKWPLPKLPHKIVANADCVAGHPCCILDSPTPQLKCDGTQKPDFVFWGNGRVNINQQGCQYIWKLADEVHASAVEMLDTPRSEVMWRVLAPTPFASFPFTSPPVRYRMPSRFNWSLPCRQNTQVSLLSLISFVNTGISNCILCCHSLFVCS